MLKACPYCGHIHDSRHDCGRRPVSDKHSTTQDTFRSLGAWQHKRAQIRTRDANLCRWCLAGGVLRYDDLSVHHIEPLEEHRELGLEDGNLITLCGRCHEMAETGKISRRALHALARTPPALPDVFAQEAPHRLGPQEHDIFPK